MNHLAPTARTTSSPAATATFSGVVAGMLPCRNSESMEVAVKATESGKIYDCTVPLSLVQEANLKVGAVVEIIGVEAAPYYVRAVGLAVFR